MFTMHLRMMKNVCLPSWKMNSEKKFFGDNYHIAAFEYLIFVLELGGRMFRKHVESLKDERKKTFILL